MEKNYRKYNKEKLEKLLADFPAAYYKYYIEYADEAQNQEEYERIVATRMTREQYFVEYLLDNGVQFERIGHWICGNDDQDAWTCSECGFPVMAADDWCDPYEAEIEYCEKCGARMIKKKG